MSVSNTDIAAIFEETADFLEIKGENIFRIRAYRTAAQTVQSLSKNAAEMIKEGLDLSDLPGIGKDIAGKMKAIVETGKFSVLEQLKKEIPPGLRTMMQISGLGAKRVRTLYDQLKITNIDDLKKAVGKKKIRELKGFGEKIEKTILEGISQIKKQTGRTILAEAEQIIKPLAEYLKRINEVKSIEVAGSIRRKMETVKDADILITCTKGSESDIMNQFTEYEDVIKIMAKGETKSSILLKSGFQVDLRIVPEESFGAALQYFTGSQAHNIAVRKIAVNKKLKINEYGVYRDQERIAGKTENEVYGAIGLPYIAPELREGRGELEAAQKNILPDLIGLEDIRGDLHTHTNITDGRYNLEDMASAAAQIGYQYIANTEHSKHLAVAKGLNEEQLRDLIRKIDRLNEKNNDFIILKSIEVDILKDGSLDLHDDILKELDFTVCSIHYKFDLTEKEQTERVIRAMDNPCFNILAHPTGRLINQRPPYAINIERILRAAKDRGCILELSARTERLDIDDVYCKAAKDIGVLVSISTDAHSIDDLGLMRYGINQARRGWLGTEDVINTRNLKDLRKIFNRK